MRAMAIENNFGVENLHLVERPVVDPGPGEVRLRMLTASLNYRDWLMVQGFYNPRQPLPLIPCSDGVGLVEAVGEGVERVAPGDRVATLFAQRWISGRPTVEKLRSTLGGPFDGTLAQHMVLSAEGVVPVPEHLSDEEAATLPCAALTAWSALVTEGQVKAGDTVLLLGTGGVSIFALQIAQLCGCRVIITSSSDEKLERARALGAWQGINYRSTQRWGKKVLELTEGRGADHVVEVGGAGTLEQSLTAAAFGGTVSLIGVLSGGSADVGIISALMKQLRLQGILVGHREGFEAMNRAFTAASLKPVVDRVLPFEEAPEALRQMAEGSHFGKICLRIGER